MENYNCELIKDIIPLYIEDICSDYTSKLIEQHVNHCTTCRELLEEIRKNDNQNPEIEKQTAIKPYKKIKRRNLLVTVTGVFLTSVVLLSLFCGFFLIGRPVSAIDVVVGSIEKIDDLTFTIELNTSLSMTSIIAAKFINTDNGIVYIIPKAVWVSPIHPHQVYNFCFGYDELPSGATEITEIYIVDNNHQNPMLIWSEIKQ